MAVLKPEHLLDQAERLIAPPPHGPPRQADLRRAISSSYYALFHLVATAAADELVGAVHQGTGRYRLVYRQIDHKTIAALCDDLPKSNWPARYNSYVSEKIFQRNMINFATTVIDLMQRRHKADYDPGPRFKTADAVITIRLAREAIKLFRSASEVERKTFLTLLVCPPR